MEDIFKIKQGDSELLREFVDRFQRERMTLPRVSDNWAAIAFTSKFLDFLVSNRGIEVNPAQINAIKETPAILSNKEEVQRLTGRIAALGKFISKLSEKCFKFFSALKKQDHFEWNEECQHALKNLKTYLI
ncbi:uncharacterized protein [Nicotiana sylvestris]|uniref:uncharacterized protein n=1 Tax=Nicotiana sylvestris TaxID=4096 RepID=UPI00388CB5CF